MCDVVCLAGSEKPLSFMLVAGSLSFVLYGVSRKLLSRRITQSVVKPRVLWWLVYLVPVVAGCDCSWRWRSGAQAASCSAGVRIPMAECGRVVPVPVDPLGGGEHRRRRCPARVLGCG